MGILKFEKFSEDRNVIQENYRDDNVFIKDFNPFSVDSENPSDFSFRGIISEIIYNRWLIHWKFVRVFFTLF